MQRALRWAGYGLLGLLVPIAVGYAAVHVKSSRGLARTYAAKPVPIAVPSDPASIEEGRRLATVFECYGGCHGLSAEGMVMFDQPLIGTIVAPDLTHAVRAYTDAQLEAVIRQGLRPDGTAVFVMPSEAFRAISDADLGRIIAFLRSLPEAHGAAPAIRLGPLGRLGMALGKFRTEGEIIPTSAFPSAPADAALLKARDLAIPACGHCHGPDLKGRSNPEFTSPDLAVAKAYTLEQFRDLLRTGRPLGGRVLPTMGPAAQRNLSHLTDGEVASLHAYFQDAYGR